MMNLKLILAFNQLVLNKTEEEKKILAQQLNIDYDEYKKRIVGKAKEADFILIMRTLDVLKHFEAYDEELSHITNEYTPDFNIVMRDGYEMMIEVKHTDKDKYKISSGNLQKRIDFANRHKKPLRFAVSLKGIWGLFTSEYLQSKNGKLVFEDFIGITSNSWLDTELATCSYIFPKIVKIRSVYSKNYTKGMKIEFPPHGQLVSYELFCEGRKIFRAKGRKSIFIKHSMYLEALQDRLANTNQDINQNGDFTTITEYLDKDSKPLVIPEYEFLLAPINHAKKNVDGNLVEYNSQLAIPEKDLTYFNVQILRSLLNELVDLGLDITVLKDSEACGFKEFASKNWGKQKYFNT